MGVDAEMFVLLHQPITDAQLIDAAYRLAEAVKGNAFFFSRNDDLEKGERRRALNRLSEDDHWLKPSIDGDWLRVPLWGRYYGPGYERGDLWQYIAIAEWIERNLHATVYYGGDSGGCEQMVAFDKAYRQELISHWADKGGTPYYQTGWGRSAGVAAPICPLCEHPATQYGSGGSFASWTCDACGRHWVWIGGTEVRMFDCSPFTRFDSFKAADEMRKEQEQKTT